MIETHKFHLLAFFSLALCIAGVRADVVYVGCDDGTIWKYGPNGVGSLIGTNEYRGACGLATDDAGTLYIGDPSNSTISKILPDGTRLGAGSIDSVFGLAFDGSSNLYAAIPNFRQIGRPFCNSGFYSLSDTNGTYWPSTQTNLSYPIDLTFDGTGILYVANGFSGSHFPGDVFNTIEMYSSDFTPLGSFASGLNNPWGVVLDEYGFVYVANSGENTILWFWPNGETNLFADASSGLNHPRDLAFDSQGFLYVANHGNGSIGRYTPEGFGTVFASGLDSPTSIAIYPGPTPPNIVLSSTSTEENQPIGTMVGSFSTQADADYTSFNYSLVAGIGSDDNSSFAIDESNLLAGVVFNYEVKRNYSVRVQSDGQGGLSTQMVFTINVLDINEPAPSFSERPVLSISNAVLSWGSMTNKQYTVHCSTNLLAGFSILQSNIPATPVINSYTDSFITVTQKYWKITTDP